MTPERQGSETQQQIGSADRRNEQPTRPDETRDEQERIARRAYERFQERGAEHGHDQEDWYEAEREVRGMGREA